MELLPMNYHYLRYPIEKFLDKVEALPFEKIDLYCSAPQINIFNYSLAKLIWLDKQIKKRHLKVDIVTPENFSYPINFCTSDYQTLEDSMRYYQRAIDTADFLDCSRVQISVGTGYFNENSRETWKRCQESLEILVAYCEKKKMQLLLEELKETSSNILNNSGQIVNMIKAINSPNLLGMMDIDQMHCYGETPKDYINNLGTKLQHIHFNDQGHRVPGDGTYPMLKYYREIVENGYNGTCSFEICDRLYFEEPDKALDRTVSWFRENTTEINW